MKVLVTGGNGFVGSHLVEKLLNQGTEVIVFDNLSSSTSNIVRGFENNDNYHFIRGDINDMSALRETITKDIDVIYHMASIVGVKRYCENPLRVIDVNVIGTRNILELSLDNKVKVLFVSTSEIFGKNPNVPWSEDADRVLGSTAIDRWSYSTSKAMCEHMIFAMNNNHGLPTIIVRLFNVYGPRQSPYFVISQNIYRVLRGEKPILYDSGEQTRCFTFVEDIVEGIMLAANNPEAVGKVFNLGSTEETSIKAVIEMIVDLTDKRDEIGVDKLNTDIYYGGKYEDLFRRIPDVSRAKKVLGWECKTRLREGLSKTISWAKENPWWLDSDNA